MYWSLATKNLTISLNLFPINTFSYLHLPSFKIYMYYVLVPILQKSSLASYLPSSNTFGELIDTQFEWFSFHDFIVVVFVKFLTRIHTFGFLFVDAYLRFNTYLWYLSSQRTWFNFTHNINNSSRVNLLRPSIIIEWKIHTTLVHKTCNIYSNN